MKNKIEDLRNHLFETIEMLKEGDKRMDVSRARTISEVAGRIIESAKVEIEFMEVAGKTKGTGFIPIEHEEPGHTFPRLAKGGARN
jgi:hypothetical protein